jgi:hypothetical protein
MWGGAGGARSGILHDVTDAAGGWYPAGPPRQRVRGLGMLEGRGADSSDSLWAALDPSFGEGRLQN